MKDFYLSLIVSSLLLCNCTHRKNEYQNLSDMEVIPITDFDTNYGRFSDFAEEIEMIPLEFTDKSILGEVKKIVLSEDFIFVMEQNNNEGIYTFDRNGNFLHQIGRRGQGPEEFVDLSDFSINEKDRLLYIFDCHSTKVLTFSFDNKFIKGVSMDYYATNFEYQNGLFYLYREFADFGFPRYALVIKDQDGNLVEKYYPMPKDVYSIHECIFRKRESDILFAQDLNDSVFTLSGSKLNPLYYIDYKNRTMSQKDRMDIKRHARPTIKILSETKALGGIKNIFDIHDKVFIKNINIIAPMLTIYDKKKKEVKTFYHWEDDLLFIASGHPIGQYKDYLLLLQEQKLIQQSIDYFDTWIKNGYLDLDKNKADKIRKMVEKKLPNRNTDECNPVLFMIKIKK